MYRRSFKNQELGMFGNMLQNDIENDKKMLSKRDQNPKTKYPKNESKNVIVFSLIFSCFGIPKGDPKSDAIRFLSCLLGSWGVLGGNNCPQCLRNDSLEN